MPISRKTIALIALVCIICVAGFISYYVFYSPSQLAPVTGEEEIKIGISLGFTGKYALPCTRMYRGISMAVNDINQGGGVYIAQYGRKLPIRLIVNDDKGEPETAVSLITKYITLDKVHVAVVAYGPELVAAAVPIAEQYQIPLLNLGTGTKEVFGAPGPTYAFSMWGTTTIQTKNIVDLTASLNPRPRRLAILTVDQTFMKEIRELALQLLTKNYPGQFEIVFDETYTMGLTDFTSILARIKQTNPDAIWFLCRESEGFAITRGMITMNWYPPFFYIARGANTNEYYNEFHDYTENVVTQANWVIDLPESYAPGISDFVQRYQQLYGEIPEIYPALGYGCVQAIAHAIEEAGSLNSNAIRDALAHLDVRTVAGHFKIGIDAIQNMVNCNIDGPYVLGQWRNGRLKCVWPPEAKTVDIVYPFPGWGVKG